MEYSDSLPDHEYKEVELIQVIIEMNENELVEQHNTDLLICIPFRQTQFNPEQFTQVTPDLVRIAD